MKKGGDNRIWHIKNDLHDRLLVYQNIHSLCGTLITEANVELVL